MSDTPTFDLEQHRVALIEEQHRSGINDIAAAEAVTISIAKSVGLFPAKMSELPPERRVVADALLGEVFVRDLVFVNADRDPARFRAAMELYELQRHAVRVYFDKVDAVVLLLHPAAPTETPPPQESGPQVNMN